MKFNKTQSIALIAAGFICVFGGIGCLIYSDYAATRSAGIMWDWIGGILIGGFALTMGILFITGRGS